ncbi:hypothetical protein D9M68_587630 [compost metagenome]
MQHTKRIIIIGTHQRRFLNRGQDIGARYQFTLDERHITYRCLHIAQVVAQLVLFLPNVMVHGKVSLVGHTPWGGGITADDVLVLGTIPWSAAAQ